MNETYSFGLYNTTLLVSRAITNTFEKQNMDNSMQKYWPTTNNGKVYTMFGGMCVLAANIPL
jgi:hypothetical protein